MWQKFMQMGKQALGGDAASKYGDQMDLGMSQSQPQGLMSMDGMMGEAMNPVQPMKQNIGLFDETGAPTMDTMSGWGASEQQSMADESAGFSAANEEGDGMFGWLQKKYPEMADMGTAESLAFLKQKGVIGSGKYHGMGQANQLGQSQAQGQNMMGSMDSLMRQAMGGSVPQQKQVQVGLMGNGGGGNPWGLMGG